MLVIALTYWQDIAEHYTTLGVVGNSGEEISSIAEHGIRNDTSRN